MKKNDRDARERNAICRELRRMFPDMSKAYRALANSTWVTLTPKPVRQLYARMKDTALWDTFSLRCRSAEQGLCSWESVTAPLA